MSLTAVLETSVPTHQAYPPTLSTLLRKLHPLNRLHHVNIELQYGGSSELESLLNQRAFPSSVRSLELR